MLKKILALFGRPDSLQKQFNRDTEHYNLFVEHILLCDQMNLYEGLPHQLFERESLTSELLTKPVVYRCKYPFYREPLSLAETDANQLKVLVSRENAFQRFYPPPGRFFGKACGGFHPDYCIEWQHQRKRYDALVCFGCNEIKFCGARIFVHYDITEGAANEFEQILKSYRKNRPFFRPDWQ